MLKLCRRSEYALMAVQHIASLGDGARASVGTIAAQQSIPRQLLAKVMQDLKRANIVLSVKGAGGGYRLTRPIDAILFVDVIAPFEEHIGLVDCAGQPRISCDRADCCALRNPITTLNTFLMAQLRRLSMSDFVMMSDPTPSCSVQAGPRIATGDLAVAHSR